MKWEAFLKAAGKKYGFSDAEITAGLANLDGDIADDVANTKLASIYTADEAKGNDAIFKEVKSKAKAEALNAIDTEFKVVEENFTAEQKAAFKALGDNTFEKTKYLTALVKNLLTAKPTGDANYDDLKKTFDELKGKVDTDYVAKTEYDSVQSKYSGARKDLVHGKLVNTARVVIKDDSKKSNRHFEKNFIDDVEALLEKGIGKDGARVSGTIDYETGKIMRKDSPEQPLAINGTVLTLEDLVPMVAEFGEWNKGYTPPPVDPIIVTGNGSANKGVSIATARTLKAVNESAN